MDWVKFLEKKIKASEITLKCFTCGDCILMTLKLEISQNLQVQGYGWKQNQKTKFATVSPCSLFSVLFKYQQKFSFL